MEGAEHPKTGCAPDEVRGIVPGCAAVTLQGAGNGTKSRAKPLLAETCLGPAGGSAGEQPLA